MEKFFLYLGRNCVEIRLTHSLPESVMETCNVVLTFESRLWTKSHGVTIQMKCLSQYYRIVLFVWQDLKTENCDFFLEVLLWPQLGVKGLSTFVEHEMQIEHRREDMKQRKKKMIPVNSFLCIL